LKAISPLPMDWKNVSRKRNIITFVLFFASFAQAQDGSLYFTSGLWGNVSAVLHPPYTIDTRQLPWDTQKGTPDNTSVNTSIGFGIYLGYGFNPWFGIYGGFDIGGGGEEYCDNCNVNFNYFEVGARVNVALPESPVVPYGTIAYGSSGFGYTTEGEEVITIYGKHEGTSLAFGAGVEIAGFDLNLQFSKLTFTEIPSVKTVRLNVGYTFWLNDFLEGLDPFTR